MKVRTLSHVCIRIEKAKELASYLTQNDSLLQIKTYKEYFSANERRNLSNSIPIFINYWTVWTENSSIIYHKDIYNKDVALEKIIRQKPYLF